MTSECKFCKKTIEYKGNIKPEICSDCRRAYNIKISFDKRTTPECDIFYLKELLKQDKCSYCGCSVNVLQRHIDHIIPVARGGTNDNDNLCVACNYCNEQKHTMTREEYKQFLEDNPDILFKRKYNMIKKTLGSIVLLEEKDIVTRKTIDELEAEGLAKKINGKYKFLGTQEDCIVHKKKLVERKCFILDEYTNGNISEEDFRELIKGEYITPPADAE